MPQGTGMNLSKQWHPACKAICFFTKTSWPLSDRKEQVLLCEYQSLDPSYCIILVAEWGCFPQLSIIGVIHNER